MEREKKLEINILTQNFKKKNHRNKKNGRKNLQYIKR